MVPHRRQPAQHLRAAVRAGLFTVAAAAAVHSRIPENRQDEKRRGRRRAVPLRHSTWTTTHTDTRRASTQILRGFCDTCANQARSRHRVHSDDTGTRHNRNRAAAAVTRRHINKPGTRRHR